MGYEVLVGNLRSAAGEYRGIESDLGSPPEIARLDGERTGHVELAAWLDAVLDQCTQAHEALAEGASGLASSLDTAAHHYDTTDQSVGETFRSPLLAPGSPFAPFAPGGVPGGVPTGGEDR